MKQSTQTFKQITTQYIKSLNTTSNMTIPRTLYFAGKVAVSNQKVGKPVVISTDNEDVFTVADHIRV